jgi:hypothetical protein
MAGGATTGGTVVTTGGTVVGGTTTGGTVVGGTTTGGTVVGGTTTGRTVVKTGGTTVVDVDEVDDEDDELDTSASASDSFNTLVSATAKTTTQPTGKSQSNPEPILYQFFAMCGTICSRKELLARNHDDEYQQLHLG